MPIEGDTLDSLLAELRDRGFDPDEVADAIVGRRRKKDAAHWAAVREKAVADHEPSQRMREKQKALGLIS